MVTNDIPGRRRSEPVVTSEAELNRRADRLAERLRQDGFIVTLSLCVTAETAAKLLSVSPRTLRDWRKNSRGPRYLTTSRTWYPLVEIERYTDLQLAATGSTRQYAAVRGRSGHRQQG